jgi:predicted ATPase
VWKIHLDFRYAKSGRFSKRQANTDWRKRCRNLNPRIVNPLLYTNINGTNRGIGFGNALASRFTSHGETMVEFTVRALKKAKSCVVFLDEPESGLSLRNQFLLWNEIVKAAKRKCQLIIATHSLALIGSAENVLSLEHKKSMLSTEFIALNRME